MATFFDPTPQERHELDDIAAGIEPVQQTLVHNHPRLTRPDRGAHQQQLAGSKVLLTVADRLPPALDGLGIFARASPAGSPLVGIGRISTGLGCPHAETDPDFLGLMVAFRTAVGRRIDFITINDPTSPTDTPEEFLALLQATADAAAATNLFTSQATLLASLTRHAGLRALRIAPHVTQQTRRTVRSSSAYQQYWTGIVRARDVFGKFTFVPTASVPVTAAGTRTPTHLTDDWRNRQNAGPLEFDLRWIPFIDERTTPLGNLTAPWSQQQETSVATVTFPQTGRDINPARLIALLASELGANPGNWDETPDGPAAPLPATRFTAARQLAYRASQQARQSLSDDSYASFFDNGEIGPALATELIRRYQQKRAAGHWVPDFGDL